MNQLIVKTLNLSGPQINPVEFFRNNSSTDIVYRLNQFVKEELPKMFSENEFKKLYTIDGEQYYTKRFSVLRKWIPFLPLSYEEYSKLWDEDLQLEFLNDPTYAENLKKSEQKELKKQPNKNISILRDQVRYFDYIMYVLFSNFFKNDSNHHEYVDLYTVAFMDEKNKTLQLVENLKEYHTDILFLQEVSTTQYDILYKHLKKSYKFSSKDPENTGNNFSVILYNPNIFGKLNYANNKYNLDIKETVILENDRFILISSHFPSKNDSKATENKGYQYQYIKLLESFYNSDKQIFIGMDANHNIKDAKDYTKDVNDAENMISIYKHLKKGFKISTCKNPTTNKERTYMQPQLHKAEKNDQGVKDFILTKNLPFRFRCKIIRMDEKRPNMKKERIPNVNHPSDHYIVMNYM